MRQGNVVADGLDSSGGIPHPDWRHELAAGYRKPKPEIAYEETLTHVPDASISPPGIVLVAGTARSTVVSPTPLPANAAIGVIPGTAVSVLVAVGDAVAV
jgi:uncharacterized membrane protein